MSLNTSKMILKVFGIISIIFGILGIIAGVMAIAGGAFIGTGLAAGEIASNEQLAGGVALLGFGGILVVVSAVIELISGYFSVKAAKDISKIMPAWVFALISLIFAIVSTVSTFTSGNNSTGTITGTIIGLAINVLIFVAANNIKQAAGK